MLESGNPATVQFAGNNAEAWAGAGGTAGGGFLYWTRFYMERLGGISGTQPTDGAVNPQAQYLMGLQATNGILGRQQPPTFANSVYVGTDSANLNFQVCSNDNSGLATCTDLGTSFPKWQPNVMYDVLLFVPPGGSNSVYYNVTNVNTGAVAQGHVDGDMPASSSTLAWHAYVNGGDGGFTGTFGWCGSWLISNL